MIHLRLTKIRIDSRTADSCEGRSGYRRGPDGLPRSKPGDGCISRITGLLAGTRGPKSMPAPQRFCNYSTSPNGAVLHTYNWVPGRRGWSVAQGIVSHFGTGEFVRHFSIG